MWQLGEQVLPCSQENILAWADNLPGRAAVAAGYSLPALCQAGEESKAKASLLRCLEPGSAFHSLQKPSSRCLKPHYPQLPAQPRRQLPLGGETEAQCG